MKLKDRIIELASAIGGKIKDLYTKIGSLSALQTTDKTTIVAAINELKSGQSSSGAVINDTTASSSATYSSTKIESVATAAANLAKSQILGGASSALY